MSASLHELIEAMHPGIRASMAAGAFTGFHRLGDVDQGTAGWHTIGAFDEDNATLAAQFVVFWGKSEQQLAIEKRLNALPMARYRRRRPDLQRRNV